MSVIFSLTLVYACEGLCVSASRLTTMFLPIAALSSLAGISPIMALLNMPGAYIENHFFSFHVSFFCSAISSACSLYQQLGLLRVVPPGLRQLPFPYVVFGEPPYLRLNPLQAHLVVHVLLVLREVLVHVDRLLHQVK